MQRVLKDEWRELLRPGERGFGQRRIAGREECEAQCVPGISATWRDATAAQQQVARCCAVAAHDQQPGQSEQRRFAPRIDLQNTAVRLFRFLHAARRAQSFRQPQGRLVPVRQILLQALHQAERAGRVARLQLGEREVEQCRRCGLAERDRRAQGHKRLCRTLVGELHDAACYQLPYVERVGRTCGIEQRERTDRVAGMQPLEGGVSSHPAPVPAR